MMRIAFVVVVLWGLCCCEKPKNITLPEHQPKLVLHAYVALGEGFKVSIGKTAINEGIIADDSTLLIKNALVVLYENGLIKDTLDFSSILEQYWSRIPATAGMTYRITVQAPGFTSVEATALAPSFVPTNSVVRIRNVRLDDLGNPQDDITFSFTDPPAEKNYYLAELNTYQFGTIPNEFCVYTYDASVDRHQGNLDPFETSSCIDNREFIFTDKLFNGNTKELTISVGSNDLKEYNIGNRIYRPVLKKYAISQEFFQYINDGITLGVLKDNPFSRPYTIPGNVKNGYGLFTVYSTVTDTLR
jgi:hypothetical protein